MWLLSHCNALMYNPSWFSHYARVAAHYKFPPVDIDGSSLYGSMELYYKRVAQMKKRSSRSLAQRFINWKERVLKMWSPCSFSSWIVSLRWYFFPRHWVQEWQGYYWCHQIFLGITFSNYCIFLETRFWLLVIMFIVKFLVAFVCSGHWV